MHRPILGCAALTSHGTSNRLQASTRLAARLATSPCASLRSSFCAAGGFRTFLAGRAGGLGRADQASLFVPPRSPSSGLLLIFWGFPY